MFSELTVSEMNSPSKEVQIIFPLIINIVAEEG